MQMDPEQLTSVLHRLRRAQGQLTAIVRMIEEGRDCEDIVTQLAAVSHAVDRAGFLVIATGMRQCMTDEAEGNPTTLDVGKLEKLFLSLA
jgi:DNA-binding FrmR family transcriptional regulator